MKNSLYLFNTLNRRKEKFVPIEEEKVRFYHCGPTVYWIQHIGNMRGMTMADLVRRSFEYCGYEVNMVRNYTDVGHLTGDSDEGEDKMVKGAKREGLTPEQIAEKYIIQFNNDIKALNILLPEYTPRATEYVSQMIEAIEVLIQKGYAYVTPMAVYFDTSKVKEYNKLSGQALSHQSSGAGKGNVFDSNKKNSQDFSLWFFKTGIHEKALQYWSSPFESPLVSNGEGFPGWHLECSVMSISLLGDTLDVHMGGIEHVPVHHTNEIAQSEAITGKPFVKYWLHNEHLLVDKSKMSKSEGTSYSLRDIFDRGFDPLDLRYLFLSAHYRSKQNFTWNSLSGSRIAREKLNSIVKNLSRNINLDEMRINDEWKDRFQKLIFDDFNIPSGLAIMWDLIKSDVDPREKLGLILDYDRIFGLDLRAQIESDKNDSISSEKIEELLKKRDVAKTNKDYETADKIRKELMDKGIILEDTKEGTVWKLK